MQHYVGKEFGFNLKFTTDGTSSLVGSSLVSTSLSDLGLSQAMQNTARLSEIIFIIRCSSGTGRSRQEKGEVGGEHRNRRGRQHKRRTRGKERERELNYN